MERRTFLKGALIAATTPAIAIAPLAAVSLSDLIAYHGWIWTECRKATAFVDGFLQNGPDFPCVSPREFGSEYYGAGADRKFFHEEEIAAYFDKLEKATQRLIDYGDMADIHMGRLARLKADRKEAIARLAAMRVERKAWEDAVGLTTAQAESDRLADLELEYDQKIMNWPIQTLDEAKQIATYLRKIHEDKIPKDAALQLVMSLAA